MLYNKKKKSEKNIYNTLSKILEWSKKLTLTYRT